MTTETLREMYSHDLQKYIASRVQGPAADDVLQQVFFKVHKKISSVRDVRHLKQRIYRITQHTIIDRYRSERTGRVQNMDEQFWEGVEQQNDSNHALIARNISSCLIPMIEDFSQKEKDILNGYLDGESYKILSEKTGESVSNIKVIIHRSKKKLQKKYTQCCYEYRDEEGFLIDTRCSTNCGCENSILPLTP